MLQIKEQLPSLILIKEEPLETNDEVEFISVTYGVSYENGNWHRGCGRTFMFTFMLFPFCFSIAP